MDVARTGHSHLNDGISAGPSDRGRKDRKVDRASATVDSRHPAFADDHHNQSSPDPLPLTALLREAGYVLSYNNGQQAHGQAGRRESALVIDSAGDHDCIEARLHHSGNILITDVCDDSRHVQDGSCFVAVRGTSVDGHDYIDRAVASGAGVVVAEKKVRVPTGVTLVIVNDTQLALSRLAAAFFGVSPGGAHAIPLVGITGTNGKSTVAWLFRDIMRAAGKRVALFGTIQYDLVGRVVEAPLTTPGPVTLCRLLREASVSGAEVGVLEVSSHALAQARTDGLSFDVAVFTNLSGDHIDYHGTVDAYRRAKARLFAGLRDSGIALLNGDDESSAFMAGQSAGRVRYFGLAQPSQNGAHGLPLDCCGVVAEDVQYDLRGSRFIMRTDRTDGTVNRRTVDVPLPGRHNVYNVLAAVAAAEALFETLDERVNCDTVTSALSNLGDVPGRLERVTSPSFSFDVFVDYAHTDDALENVLRTLKPLTRGRLICVFGCGGDRDRSKRARMAAVAGSYADRIFVTSDNPRTESPEAIIDDIVQGLAACPRERWEREADRRTAIFRAISAACPGDALLIAGKGHETYQIVGVETVPFDDTAVAREAIATFHGSADAVVQREVR